MANGTVALLVSLCRNVCARNRLVWESATKPRLALCGRSGPRFEWVSPLGASENAHLVNECLIRIPAFSIAYCCNINER